MTSTLHEVATSLNERGKKAYIPDFQVPVSLYSQDELLDFVEEAVQQQTKVLIDHLNIDNLWYAQQDREYQHILNEFSTVNLMDGMPVCWLARLAGYQAYHRMALTDIVPALLKLSTINQYSVFVVGSSFETISAAKKRLYAQGRMPHTMACWTEPRHKLNNPHKNQEVLHMIQQTQPDILLVALGAPWQTKWIGKNWEQFPDCVIIPVGGAFDYIAGNVGRAPAWMRQTGLEWIYRLFFDTQRRERSLFERYVLTDVPFAIQIALKIAYNRRLKGKTTQKDAVSV